MKKISFVLIALLALVAFTGCPTAHDDLDLLLGDWYYIDADVSGLSDDSGFLFVNNSGAPQTKDCDAAIVSSLAAGKTYYLAVDNVDIVTTDMRPDESGLPALDSGKCRIFCFNSGLDVMWAWDGITPAGSNVPGFPWGDASTAGMTKL